MQFYAGFADSPLEDARELGRVCPITYGETDKPLAIAKGWNYLGRVKANGASSPHWPTSLSWVNVYDTACLIDFRLDERPIVD